jgi:hypothetical protein
LVNLDRFWEDEKKFVIVTRSSSIKELGRKKETDAGTPAFQTARCMLVQEEVAPDSELVVYHDVGGRDRCHEFHVHLLNDVFGERVGGVAVNDIVRLHNDEYMLILFLAIFAWMGVDFIAINCLCKSMENVMKNETKRRYLQLRALVKRNKAIAKLVDELSDTEREQYEKMREVAGARWSYHVNFDAILGLFKRKKAFTQANVLTHTPEPLDRITYQEKYYSEYLGTFDEKGGTIKSVATCDDGSYVLLVVFDQVEHGERWISSRDDKLTIRDDLPKFSQEDYWQEERLADLVSPDTAQLEQSIHSENTPEPLDRITYQEKYYSEYLGTFDEKGGTIKSVATCDDGSYVLLVVFDQVEHGERWISSRDDKLTIRDDLPKFSQEDYWQEERLADLVSPDTAQLEQSSELADAVDEIQSKKKWPAEEDKKLVDLVAKHGLKKWSVIANELPGRNNNQCQKRWFNVLDPAISKAPWSEDEDRIILTHQRDGTGGQWAKMSREMVGRPGNAIRNHWNNSMKRKVEEYIRSKNIDGVNRIKDDGVYLIGDDIEGCLRAARATRS